MNKLIVAHIRPPNAYEITRTIVDDKEEEVEKKGTRKRRRRGTSRGVRCCSVISVQIFISHFLFLFLEIEIVE
jgi:hypothetical protein